MAYTNEDFKIIASIYRELYKESSEHRNIVRKVVLKRTGTSKEKYNKAIYGLVSLGNVSLNGEQLSLNNDEIKLGMLQKSSTGNNLELLLPNNKHITIDASNASGYNMGDFIDFAQIGGKIVLLGKSSKTFNKHKEKTLHKYDDKSDCLVLGRVVKIGHDDLVFIPNRKDIPLRRIPILNSIEEYPNLQDKLCIMKLENIDAPAMGGTIVQIKGDAGNPIHEYDAIAESCGAIMTWDDAQDEIDKIPSKVDASKLNLITEEQAKIDPAGKVVDLRHLPFVTVDPATCKDMDDAIYSTIDENGNTVCYTAVANVTKYVDFNSKIGKKYIEGAFTIYAPNKAYNILPTKLSTGICSLNPNQDRLAFVVKTVIDVNGNVIESNIYDSIIKSRHRYSYEQAQEIVNSQNDEFKRMEIADKIASGEELSLDEQTIMNYYAGEVIKKGFEKRQMIRFVSNKERDIIFDNDLDDVVDIKPVEHLEYHEVIEAFMITANEATAKYAKDHNLPNVYRVHDKPSERKTQRAGEFFKILGIDFDGDFSAQGTRNLIERIHNTSSEEVVNEFLIRTQSRAKYDDKLYRDNEDDKDATSWLGDKISHYALQSKHYSHTTSPIRRIPDYFTQFNILADIHGKKKINQNVIASVIKHANDRQLVVDQSEKDFADISSVLYCEKHIGEKMTGKVTKLRYTTPEEGFEDEIVVVVKNDDKGISVEIPLSEVLGRKNQNCSLSEQFCAVYDENGNTVLTLCKPVDFIIASADRLTMNIVGKTNKQMVDQARRREENKDRRNLEFGSAHKKEKKRSRDRRDEDKKHARVDEDEKTYWN